MGQRPAEDVLVSLPQFAQRPEHAQVLGARRGLPDRILDRAPSAGVDGQPGETQVSAESLGRRRRHPGRAYAPGADGDPRGPHHGAGRRGYRHRGLDPA